MIEMKGHNGEKLEGISPQVSLATLKLTGISMTYMQNVAAVSSEESLELPSLVPRRSGAADRSDRSVKRGQNFGETFEHARDKKVPQSGGLDSTTRVQVEP